MEQTERLLVGRIVGTHGIRGEVRVLPNTDFPERRFAPQTRLFLSHESLAEPISVFVKKSRPHKHFLLIQFEEWNRINEVERWRDAELWVPVTEAALDELGEEEYYFHQIIGCSVRTAEGKKIGKVKEILPYPANDVWVVESNRNGKELFIPYVKEFVKKVDLENRQVTIEWMKGLEMSGKNPF